MSEHTAHIAIFEDTSRMVLHSKKFCKEFKSSLKEHYETAAIASESKSGDMFIIPFIKVAREANRRKKVTRESKQLLAAALGWTSHKAADYQVKPLANEHNYNAQRFKDPFPVWNEKIEALQDVTVFKNVYEATNKNTNSSYLDFGKFLYQKDMDSIPAAAKIKLERAEPLMAAMWKADFLSLHQLSSNTDYSDSWLKNLFDRTQSFNEVWDYYIEAYQNPDPQLKEYLLNEKNFYNPQDKLIKWVRDIQLGNARPINEELAIKEAGKENASQYARLLSKAYRYLTAANEFFSYETDEIALMKAWDAVG